MITHTIRWSHPPGNTVVPSRWQATPARSIWRPRWRRAPPLLNPSAFQTGGEQADHRWRFPAARSHDIHALASRAVPAVAL